MQPFLNGINLCIYMSDVQCVQWLERKMNMSARKWASYFYLNTEVASRSEDYRAYIARKWRMGMIKMLLSKLLPSDNHDLTANKRPVGLYSPLTAGIMTDFIIMIIILSSINKSVSQSLIIHDFIINYDKSSSMTLIIIHQSWSIIITKSSVMFLIIINQ